MTRHDTYVHLFNLSISSEVPSLPPLMILHILSPWDCSSSSYPFSRSLSSLYQDSLAPHHPTLPPSSAIANIPIATPPPSNPFLADAAGQLNILWHDRHALAVDGADVGVLKESNKISLGRLLVGEHGCCLEP